MRNNMKWFEMNNLPIRYKLIIHFLLISILPSLGLGVLIGWTVDRIIERQVNDNTVQIIDKVNQTLEFYISNMQNITYLISFNPAVRTFLEEPADQQPGESVNDYDIRKFLQGFTTLHSEVAGILLVNSDGEYISNEMYARSAKSLTKEVWYQEAVNNHGIFKIVGHPIGRNVTTHVNYRDDDVISVVRAILDPDTQQVQGVVLIDLKLRVIAETAKDVRLGKWGYLMVIDNNGDNIYIPTQPFIESIPPDWFGETASGTFSKQVNGTKLQFIYRTSPFTNWKTVGVFSTKESVFEVREIRFYLISFVFFVCLLGIAASYYLSYSISRPIGQLMSFMRKAEAGDMTTRYLGERTDEVGMLGRSFNRMIAQVNKLISLTELQERQKREAELRSLQAYIKPHFLYNTLDTIHWMVQKKGADDVAEVVRSLSQLFRIGLSKGNNIIPLIEEMNHIRSYLIIQKTRYQDKLNYSLNIDDGLKDVAILKLVLQPIVENAIYHGIKERRGPGHIAINLTEEEGCLVIRIKDDGVGMPSDTLQVLREKLNTSVMQTEGEEDTTGYGMMNVQARIKLTFGDMYGLSLQSELGKGTTVTIIHPIIRENKSLEDGEGK